MYRLSEPPEENIAQLIPLTRLTPQGRIPRCSMIIEFGRLETQDQNMIPRDRFELSPVDW
jgi:hypothetical protein